MDKKTGIIIAVIILIFGAVVGISIAQGSAPRYDYSSFDPFAVAVSDPANGNFGDLIEGDPDAPVQLIEYGNYQCTACAALNPKIAALVESYDGQVALVYRAMSLPDHDNGTASSAAALAAAKQGYWPAYKDTLYENQNEWYYATGSDRQLMFETYLLAVSNGQADLEQFRADMTSTEVSQKIAFDEKMAQAADAAWSPYFLLDGENISQQGMSQDNFIALLREKIDAKLAALQPAS